MDIVLLGINFGDSKAKIQSACHGSRHDSQCNVTVLMTACETAPFRHVFFRMWDLHAPLEIFLLCNGVSAFQAAEATFHVAGGTQV